MLYYVLRPLSYLKINNKSKKYFDWWVPLFFAILTSFVIVSFRNQIIVFGNSGLIARLSEFIQIMPGFFLAALVATATFSRPEMDDYLPGAPWKAWVLSNGRKSEIRLTQRRFLCMLFSFLTVEAMIIFLFSVACLTFSDSMKVCIPEPYHVVAYWAFFMFFGLLFWQMVTATMIGLYFLGDRIHHPDMRTKDQKELDVDRDNKLN